MTQIDQTHLDVGIAWELPIDVLALPVRVVNALRRAGIRTPGDLAERLSREDLRRYKGIGNEGVRQIRQALHCFRPEEVVAWLEEVAECRAPVKAVEALLPLLLERERRVLELRFGLADGRLRGLKEIADVEGVSYSMVQAVHERVRWKLLAWRAQTAMKAAVDAIACVIAEAGGVIDWRVLDAHFDASSGNVWSTGALWLVLTMAYAPEEEAGSGVEDVFTDLQMPGTGTMPRFAAGLGLMRNGVADRLAGHPWREVGIIQRIARPRVRRRKEGVHIIRLVVAVQERVHVPDGRFVEACVVADPRVELAGGRCRFVPLPGDRVGPFAVPRCVRNA